MDPQEDQRVPMPAEVAEQFEDARMFGGCNMFDMRGVLADARMMGNYALAEWMENTDRATWGRLIMHGYRTEDDAR